MIYAVICHRFDLEYSEKSFSHIAFVTRDLNIAEKFKSDNHDKYLGADVYLDVSINLVPEMN